MKHKQFMIYLIFIMVILLSFILPKLFTNQEEKKIFSEIYVADKKIQILDKKNENAELINTINSKYHNSPKYEINVSDYNKEIAKMINIRNDEITISDDTKILNKIEDLVKQEIIREEFLKDFMKEKRIIYRVWDYDNGEITYSKIKIFTSEDNFEKAIANLEVENVTNKIIGFTLKKEYVNTEKSNLEKYVEYLELDTYHDWSYSNHELKSKQSGVKITSTEENENICVTLLPFD